MDRAPTRVGLYHLSHRELSVLRMTAAGLSSKEVGAALAIAPETSRGTLERTIKKLGVTRAAEAPIFWTAIQSACSRSSLPEGGERLVFRCELPEVALPGLTASEKELAAALALGRTNLEISRLREVSPRTVANQLHSLFRKLRVSSRGELAALLLRSESTKSGSAEP